MINDASWFQRIREENERIESVEVLKGGINSEVALVVSNKRRFIVKRYIHEAKDIVRRIQRECGMLRLLEICNENSPRSIAVDLSKRWHVLSYVEGEKVEDINSDIVAESVGMTLRTTCSALEMKQIELLDASEACWSIQDHIAVIRRRLYMTKQSMSEKSIDPSMMSWLEQYVFGPSERIIERTESLGVSIKEDRVVSQSDVGIHNILEHKGSYMFVDFEHGGWDSIYKFCVDWLIQPNTVGKGNVAFWLSEALAHHRNIRIDWGYVGILLGLYRYKWCFIMLRRIEREESTCLNQLSDDIYLYLKQSNDVIGRMSF